MTLPIETSKSHFVAFTAVFAAMIAVLDVIPMFEGFYSGIWDSWIFLLSPLIGVLLGPMGGFFAVGMGSLVGHIVFFRDVSELFFMIGAPVGAAMAGLVYQNRWKPALGFYSLLLGGYFIDPVTWILPLWGIWDTLFAYGLLLVFSLLARKNWWDVTKPKRELMQLIFCTVIGLEADILTRVFLFVPGQLYWIFYGLTPTDLQLLWLAAGIITPIKVLLSVIMMVTLGYQVLKVLPDHIIQSGESSELDDDQLQSD